mgnify:CR=1 FL=1
MKTPTWANIVGICMIVFGGCSLNDDIQSVNSPMLFDLQEEIFDEISGEIESKSDSVVVQGGDSTTIELGKTDDQVKADSIANKMKDMLHISEYTKTWLVRFGYIGVVISIIYLLGGIFLMVKKPFSIQLAYGALALSSILGIVKTSVLSSDSSGGLVAMTAGLSQIFGILIDIVILAVIFSSNKEAYQLTDQIDQ